MGYEHFNVYQVDRKWLLKFKELAGCGGTQLLISALMRQKQVIYSSDLLQFKASLHS